jgi:hypothetical protein
MSVYWLTFRIHEATIGGRSYEARYEMLNDVIDDLASVTWKDPTSFIVFESGTGIGAIMSKCKSAIAPSHDLVLIREMDKQSALTAGLIEDPDIFKMITYLKKV